MLQYKIFHLGSCGFVILWRLLWREDGSVIYCYCLASPALSLSGLIPTALNFWNSPNLEGLLRLAGLLLTYSNPPPHGLYWSHCVGQCRELTKFPFRTDTLLSYACAASQAMDRARSQDSALWMFHLPTTQKFVSLGALAYHKHK
jgi:hypothetical protein